MGEFPLDLGSRQHVKPRDQDSRLHGRGLGAIEAEERRMRRLGHGQAVKSWSLAVVARLRDLDLLMGERRSQTPASGPLRRHYGPVPLATAHAAGEHPDIGSIIDAGEWMTAQVFQRRR